MSLQDLEADVDRLTGKVDDLLREHETLKRLLRRVVVGWDGEESIEFVAAITAARKSLGLKLANEEAREDAEMLVANGYTEDGEPIGAANA